MKGTREITSGAANGLQRAVASSFNSLNLSNSFNILSRRFAAARPLRLLIWVVLFKIAYLGLLCAAICRWDDFNTDNFRTMMAHWPRDGPPVFASHFATWDSAHYLYLSEVGYQHTMPSCAFYPLWPLLVRWLAPLAGGSHILTGLILANLFSLAAWLLFHRHVAARWGQAAANWSLVFLMAFPGALFFQFNYTESLFLLLALVLWWALDNQRYGWAWLSAVLLPLTRGPGVFALLPIAWHVLQSSRLPLQPASERGHSCPPERVGGTGGQKCPRSDASRVRASLLLAPLLGWTVYLGLMWHWTGNPFEGMQAQKYWGVHSLSNLWNVPKFVIGLFTPTEWHEFRGSLLDRAVFMLLLYCLPTLWRLDKGLLVWIYVLGILPAMSGTFTSFTRFASCAFPMFIALGAGLCASGWRLPRYALLAVFICLHLVLVWRFVNFRWAG